MGRDVIFTYRRRIHAMSSPPSPSRSSATNDSMESLHDASRSKKSLTPQRKHHKLLKDGSEVWSQEVEAIFVDGLRKYWESPWATYSRGRSRWRNQFLVDHLKRAGIERSKKQVASHIQVLRNMWRGEPEFHLVAGGEELFQENGLLAPSKQKASADPPETSSPSTLEFVESSRRSPSSNSSPEYSASEFSLDLPSPISLSHVASPPHTVSYGELSVDDSVGMPLPHISDAVFGSLPSPPSHVSSTVPLRRSSMKLEPLIMDPALFTLPHGSFIDTAIDYSYVLPPPNRVSNISLWADGIAPLTIDVDRLTSARQSSPCRVLLHVKVCMPSATDLRSPPQLQGLNGAVSFVSRWATVAKCHTKIWAMGQTCISQEVGFFDQALPDIHASDAFPPPMVSAYLPSSSLTRCKWLETVQTITQQIVVDNEVLAVLMYHIERTADSTTQAPFAELMGFQKYPWRSVSASQPFVSPPLSPNSPTFTHEYASSAPVSPQSPNFPQGEETSLSSALSFSRPMYGSVPNSMHPPRMF